MDQWPGSALCEDEWCTIHDLVNELSTRCHITRETNKKIEAVTSGNGMEKSLCTTKWNSHWAGQMEEKLISGPLKHFKKKLVNAPKLHGKKDKPIFWLNWKYNHSKSTDFYNQHRNKTRFLNRLTKILCIVNRLPCIRASFGYRWNKSDLNISSTQLGNKSVLTRVRVRG